MNPILEKALLRAQEGDPGALAEFGFERHTLKGPGIPGDGNEWEERMTLTGEGVLRLSKNRSIGDISSEAIGAYRRQAGREVVGRLIRMLRETRWEELPRFRVEPADTRIRIHMAAAGVIDETVVGFRDPMAIRPVKPLLQELDRLAASLAADPVRTLRVDLQMPRAARVAKMRLPVTLRFRNDGPEGYWLTHPKALARALRWEQCGLVYGRQPELVPGFTPPAIERQQAALEPAEEDVRDLLWVRGAAEIAMRFTCVLEPAQAGRYLARAVYSTYQGEDRVAGRPRLRGCSFSNEVEIEVA